MDHALLGGFAQRGGDLPHDREGRLQQGRTVSTQPLAEILALHVLLHDVMQAVNVAHLVDLHDIGMHQRGGSLGLALEPPEVGLIVGEFRPEDFDCDPAFQVTCSAR